MPSIPTIFDSAHVPLGLLNSSGILLEANQSSLDLFGTDAVQVPGKPFWETQWWVGSPGSAGKLEDAVNKSVRGEFSRFEAEHIDADGNRSYIDFTVTPIRGEKNKVTSLVIEGRDITALTESQQALVEAEKRFRALLDLSSDWYWEQDEQYRFIEISGNGGDLGSTPVASQIGKCRWEFPIPKDSEMTWSNHQALLVRHESFRNFEYKRFNEAGDTTWISTSGDAVFDSENNFQGYRGTSRNITTQKQSEFTDKENALRQRLAVEIAGIGVWEWDMISDQVIWGDKQFELFGLNKVEGPIPLSTTIDAIHPDDRERLNNKAKEVFEDGATAAEEFRIVHPDGSVHWLLGCSGVVKINDTGHSARLVGFNMDITKTKKIEMALRASQKQFQAVNKTLENRIIARTAQLETEEEQRKLVQSELAIMRRLESIGKLAGGVAHDFNNLLAGIGGNLELAAPHVTHEEASEMIADARLAVETGVRLNQRLLSFAQRQKLTPIKASVSKRVLDTVHLLKRTLGENFPIVADVGPGLWDTFADAAELDSALINLVINARDAMPGGGSITIEARNMVLGADDAELSQGAQRGEYVGISVTDTGTGMSADVVDKALEPFYTTKEQGKGTGLGLSSVYGFVQQSQGFLTIDSHVGKGTTVRFHLPRALDEADSQSATVTVKQTPSSNNELILVVEDEAMVRKVMVKRLKHLGYRVLEASTAQQAIDVMKSGAPVDLVFSDIAMPGGMTGYELADWLAINNGDVCVLLTSGYIEPSALGNGNSIAEKFKIIRKPCSMELLAQGIQEALGSRQWSPP